MISAPNVESVLKTSSTVRVSAKCLIEYNINSMVNFADNAIVTPSDYVTDQRKKFKKLFPIDTIVQSHRPESSGIKYYINGDIDSGTLLNPAAVEFKNDYRTYIPGKDTYYKYWISDKGGSVDISITYPKTILVNKIVVRFELSHATPQSWEIYGNGTKIADGTSANIIPFQTSGNKNFDSGTLTIYWNGTSWTTTEPATIQNPVSFTSVKLVVPAITNDYIGVIEIAPKLVKDISADIVSFDIQKEASSTTENIIPVGYVSSNLLNMNLNRYDQDEIKYKVFSKSDTDFNSSYVYLFKNAKIIPYINVYTSDSIYESIKQGVFYLDSYSISEYGDIQLQALDGAKILMETIAPDILCQDFSITAIIRRLLDTIGFTSYNINLKLDPNGSPSLDSGIITPGFWWTEDSKTVWQTIQELCRDSQITAVFDENGILQFYTRDYFYDNDNNPDRLIDWKFSNEPYTQGSGQNAITVNPNIIDFSKDESPSANKIIITWSNASKANYAGDAAPVWRSDTTFLGALSVTNNIAETIPQDYLKPTAKTTADGDKRYIGLKPIVPSKYFSPESLYSFSGYLLIDDEVIEYDAIEYAYVPIGGGLPVYVDIESEGDMLKYRGLSEPGLDNFYASGRYRIKTRGALGTVKAAHSASTQSSLNGWTEFQKEWA